MWAALGWRLISAAGGDQAAVRPLSTHAFALELVLLYPLPHKFVFSSRAPQSPADVG